MAVGMFKLTLKQRNLLLKLFNVLNAVQIVFGAIMTTSSLYIFITIAPILHTEKAEISFVFIITALFGTHVILHWSIGIKVAMKSHHQPDKKSTNNLLFFWLCMGTYTVISVLLVSHFARKIEQHIIRSLKQSIATGIRNYLNVVTWKETVDELQYKNECCGIVSFTDWHTIKWLNKYHIDMKSEYVKQFRTSAEPLTFPIVPWSCCKVSFPMQCLHDPLQQILYAHIWVDEPSMITNSINTEGCLDGLKTPVLAVITIFIGLSSFICTIHVIIFCIGRLLYTSSRNALLLGTPKGLAPGWIFGRGDCGYRGGKTLAEIMNLVGGEKLDKIKVTQPLTSTGETTGKSDTEDEATRSEAESKSLREELQRLQQ